MTVLYNLAFLPRQGAGLATYALNLLEHLHPHLPLTVLSARPLGDYPHQSVGEDLSVDRAGPGLRRRILWNQWQLPRLYAQLGARLHFCPIPEGPVLGGCRTVVTVHDLIPLHFPGRFRPLLELYYRHYLPAVLGHALHVLADSRATAADLVHFYRLSASRITVVPLAHDSRRFYPRGDEPADYFLYLGRADWHKNLETLLRAFARVPGEADLRLVGTGRVEGLAQLARELGIGHRVRFEAYVLPEELPGLVGRALALVMPSLAEGFGLPVLEAMAMGTPVIASNCSSLPEVAGDAALLVDPGDTGALAEAMRSVREGPGLRQHLSHLGLARARKFSWEQTARATAEILMRYL